MLKSRLLIILTIFLFLSCSNPVYKPYTLSDLSLLQGYEEYKYNSETSSQFTERLVKYENILKTSPVPLYIMPMKEFRENYILKAKIVKFDKIEIAGLFVDNNKVKGWPNKFIFIKQNMPPENIMACFFHELGHHYCNLIRCECLLVSRGEIGNIEAELHAMISEIKEAIKFDVPEVLGTSLMTMTDLVTSDDSPGAYKEAALMISDHKVFIDTVSYLSNKIDSNIVTFKIIKRDD